MPIKINGATSGSTTITAPDTGSDETIELSTALAAKLDRAGGKILQVVSTTKTDTFTASVSAGAGTLVTGLTATITPTSNTSKILVLASVTGNQQNRNSFHAALERGGTLIGVGASASNRTVVGAMNYSAVTDQGANLSLVFVDSPASTSALTYGVQIRNADPSTRTVYVNRSESDPDTAAGWRSSSTITVMEVSA